MQGECFYIRFGRFWREGKGIKRGGGGPGPSPPPEGGQGSALSPPLHKKNSGTSRQTIFWALNTPTVAFLPPEWLHDNGVSPCCMSKCQGCGGGWGTGPWPYVQRCRARHPETHGPAAGFPVRPLCPPSFTVPQLLHTSGDVPSQRLQPVPGTRPTRPSTPSRCALCKVPPLPLHRSSRWRQVLLKENHKMKAPLKLSNWQAAGSQSGEQ